MEGVVVVVVVILVSPSLGILCPEKGSAVHEPACLEVLPGHHLALLGERRQLPSTRSVQPFLFYKVSHELAQDQTVGLDIAVL